MTQAREGTESALPSTSPRTQLPAMRFLMRMLLPSKWLRDAGDPQDFQRYRRIWRYVVLLTLLVSLTPLAVMTGLNHFMLRRALASESRYDVARALSTVSRSLEFVIQERMSALQLLVEERGSAELSSSDKLAVTLRNLKQSFGGFVDLGLIGPDGVQHHYAGPYNLEGDHYEDQDWFREVVVRGLHVSEVFMGHRQLPHFVIAVRRDAADGSFVVLRATVDMELLTSLVFVPDLGPSDDVFVISRDGVLQTRSRHHGNLLEPCTIPVPPLSPGAERIERFREGGVEFDLGYRRIARSPFILVVLKSNPIATGPWERTRTELLTILVVGSILIGLVVLWSSTYMVRQIRVADLRRTEMLHRMEFTAKMATIGRLAASVAHEINNPLAIINEKAGLLKDLVQRTTDHPHAEKNLKSLDSIIKSVERCGNVTHRLLGFTRSMEANTEPIVLSELLQEVLGFTGKEAVHRSITVDTRFEEGVSPVEANRGQLQQVFLNIINNAFAAVEHGGRVHLIVEQPRPNRVRVTVQDDGVGIPEEKLPYVFEPFFSMKGKFGTGLGLSITYDLVQKMGGRIDIRSKLGEGTSVIVELPSSAA